MASMHLVAGMPKRRKGTKVAARSRLDAPADMSMAPFRTGMRNELMPKAKPMEKKNNPTKAKGT